MSNPIVSAAAAALRAGRFPKRFGKRENKVVESVKAYVDGAAPASHSIVAAGTFTCIANINQTITVACVATDVVQVSVKSNATGTLFVHTAAAGAGSIAVNLDSAAVAGDVLQYVVVRAK